MEFFNKPSDPSPPASQPSWEIRTEQAPRAAALPQYSELGQDRWVVHETGGKREGVFVEFGAGDGVKNSNTYLLETAFAWRGVLAEPHPEFFHKACAQRAVPVAHRCIYPGPERVVPFLLAPDPHLSTIADFAYADHHAAERARGQIVTATTLSLHGLLEQYAIPPVIDYMSIDTEGSELDIIADFDFNQYDVRLISIEHNYTPRREKIRLFLEQVGYRRKFANTTQYDDWYVKAA